MAKSANNVQAAKPQTSQWTVMFIDLVDSTGLKYKVGAAEVAQIITELFKIIQEKITSKGLKFTGDGAMAIFEGRSNGALSALDAAERILQRVDSMNLKFNYPRIHIRIGIATGECYVVSGVTGSTELSGKTADLAARLQGEAEIDSILVDEATKQESRLPEHRFTECDRRLSLKGVPISSTEKPESFYFFKADRLLKPPKQDHYSKGLLALYPDRPSLFRDLSAIRLIHLAKQDSTILVAGRTLRHWTELGAEMRHAVKDRNVKFHFVISSERLSNSVEISRYLDAEQIAAMKEDLPKARNYFLDLVEEEPGEANKHFQLRETDHLILDGITCAEIALPGNEASDGKLITLQDINAAPGENKATFLLACRGNPEEQRHEESCMAHGLYKRTNLIFEKAKELTRPIPVMPVEQILRQHRESSKARNNSPAQYADHIRQYFPLIKAGELTQVPAPICIQMQVSSTCSTHCRMCDHWKTPKKNELAFEDWERVFKDVAEFGVKSVIFSGGEPLMNPDITALLQSANENGLSIGLLTNGTMLDTDAENRRNVIEAIKEHVKWVAISIDGTPSEDKEIRQPKIEERRARLKEFCDGLDGGPDLSATVTLQKNNIDMNIKKAIEFITKELGIPKVNFKLATGSTKALDKDTDFLLSEEQLKSLEHFLWKDALIQNDNNNLDYLRRCFANGTFNIANASKGHPTSSFYELNNLRCHTPFLFSLIDSDGAVYPCCHLYRDNHGSDTRTSGFRETHLMGNVKHNKFGEIWNGERYEAERNKLERINPNADFSPCGECTRHCQHNRVLTQIYREYEKDSKALDGLTDASPVDNENPVNKPVWF